MEPEIVEWPAQHPLWKELWPLGQGQRRPAPRTLGQAAEQGDLAAMRRFRDKGHPVCPLEFGARSGSVEILRFLLECGAKPRLTEEEPAGKAMQALAGDRAAAMLDALLEVGISDHDFGTALGHAASFGRYRCVKRLLASDLDLESNETLLAYTKQLDWNEDGDRVERRNGQSMREHLAGLARDGGHAQLARHLCGHDVDESVLLAEEEATALPPLRPSSSDPAVANSANDGDVVALAKRIRNGEFSDLCTLLHGGGSPLGYALEKMLLPVAEALLDAGATETRLVERIAATGSVELLNRVLSDADTPAKTLNDALVAGAAAGHLDVVRHMLARGANPRHIGRNGSAMDLASGEDQFLIRSRLRESATGTAVGKGVVVRGKRRLCKGEDGVDELLAYLLDGDFEVHFLALRSSVSEATGFLNAELRPTMVVENVAKHAVPAVDDSQRAHDLYLLGMKDHDWTIAIHNLGRPWPALAFDLEPLSQRASAALETTVVTCAASKDPPTWRHAVYEQGSRREKLAWSLDDRLDDFQSELRDPPRSQDTAGAFVRQLFSQQQLYVPALGIDGDGFEQQLVVRNIGLRQLAGVNFLSFSPERLSDGTTLTCSGS